MKKEISLVLTLSLAFVVAKTIDLPKTINSYYAFTNPNDAQFIDQWAIEQVELNKAWDIYTGSSSINVGVIDSGIDAEHEDLSDNINSSLSTHFGNYNISALQDNVGHGSHVSGIIGAVGNNNIGISGACWDVGLVSLSIATSSIYFAYIEGISEAVTYASNSSSYIPILNASIGSSYQKLTNYGYDIFELISDFNTAMNSYDGLLICAAGNSNNMGTLSGVDIGIHNNPIFPSTINKSNMIVVGNSDQNDNKASDSNYSQSLVHLFAPGSDILSTIPGDDYDSWSGTSMAAPLVTGTAALLKSIDPDLTSLEIKEAILDNVDVINGLANYCSTSGRLNAYKAALSILPEIVENGQSYTYNSKISHQKFMKINCQNGHYSLTIISPNACRVTLYNHYVGTPLIQQTYSTGGTNTIDFLSSSTQTIYLRVENLGNSDCNNTLSLSYQNHSYTNNYSYYSPLYHKAYCSCGNYVLMPHIIYVANPDDQYGVCAICSHIVPFNPLLTIVDNDILLCNNNLNHFDIIAKTIIQCFES